MKPTFQQLATLCICLVSLAATIVVYVITPHGEDRGFVLGVLSGTFTGSGAFFYKSSFGSQAKDDANKNTMDNLVTNLAKSKPADEPVQ